MYSNFYLMRSMEMSLTMFTLSSKKSGKGFSISFLHSSRKIRVKTCVTSKYHILKLLLVEEHGDVLDNVRPSSKENSNFEGLIFRQISDVNDITTF